MLTISVSENLGRNNMSAFAMSESTILTQPSTTTIDDTIPEESSVEVGETSYQPTESPSSETLPPIPLDFTDQTPVDLDAQIEELQHELEKCKTGDSNHTTPPPGDVDVTDSCESTTQMTEAPRVVMPDGDAGAASSNVDADESMPDATVSQQRALSVCRVLTIMFFVMFTVMVSVVLLVLESELDMPVLKDIRQMPELQHFKHQHYAPLKATLARRVGGWFK